MRGILHTFRYGHLDSTDEEIEEAEKLAHAHHFIKQLPEGDDTILSDNGSNLSHEYQELYYPSH